VAEAIEPRVPGPDGDRTVRVSNPGKVYFPDRGITKRQLVEYYLAVAEPRTAFYQEGYSCAQRTGG
jgi:DNA primase